MANVAPAWVQLHPSYMEPGLLLPYTQASGAFELLASGNPLVKISSEDLAVYIKQIFLRTRMAAGQAAYNLLPSINVLTALLSTPTYLQRVRAEYDHHDTAQMAAWGVSITEAQRLGMRQAHFQLLRSKLLYGLNPANGEGILNASGITSVNLPPDSQGHATILTYDNGELAMYFLSLIQSLKTRTNQLGMPLEIVILGPQRVLGVMEYQNIVQLVQYQRPGAGTATTAGVIKTVAGENGDTIIWAYDDTLIGAGAGGNDAIVIAIPEVKKPEGGAINTNEFAELAPGISAVNLMYNDLAAPKEIPTPIAGGAIDIVSELRSTCGWVLRPEGVTVLSAQYQ